MSDSASVKGNLRYAYRVGDETLKAALLKEILGSWLTTWTLVSSVSRQPRRPTMFSGASSMALPTEQGKRLFYSALFCAASLWALCVLLDTTEQKSHKTLRGCLKEGYKNGESLGGKTYEEELKTLVCLTWEMGDWGETSSQSVGLLMCQGAGR